MAVGAVVVGVGRAEPLAAAAAAQAEAVAVAATAAAPIRPEGGLPALAPASSEGRVTPPLGVRLGWRGRAHVQGIT